MNGWTEEGRHRYQQLFHEVIHDQKFYGRSFDRRFKVAFDKVAIMQSRNQKKMAKEEAAKARARIVLFSDLNCEEIEEGAKAEHEANEEAKELERELLDLTDDFDDVEKSDCSRAIVPFYTNSMDGDEEEIVEL